ncbi:unnamed protein product, partial [Adineta steineri]
SVFANINPQRNIDLQLPDGNTISRRSSYGSDTESRLASGSPIGSVYNSDGENDPKSPETPMHITQSPILRHRMAHKIQH